MNPNLEACLRFTFGWEGGFSNDAGDPGGKTMYGITEAVARGWGYIGPMNLLPKEMAEQIYLNQYWNPLQLDKISDLLLQKRMFDFAVNCGVPTAILHFQATLNRINNRGTRWADISEDGHMGGATLNAANACLLTKYRALLLFSFDCSRADYYLEDIEHPNDDTNEKFITGWMRRTAALIEESVKLLMAA